MKKATFDVSNAVLDVLARSTVRELEQQSTKAEGWVLLLPSGQLDRKLYQEVNKVLEGFGGKWDRKRKGHVFTSDPRLKLGATVQTGKAVNEQQQFQSFYTPLVVARRMAQMAEIAPFDCILEPSAGEGALVEAALWIGAEILNIDMVEINPTAIATLQKKFTPASALTLFQTDFLTMESGKGYDRVLMNPPFHGGADAYHTMHAFEFLRPGGIQVALISNAYQANTRAPYPTFRMFLDEYMVEFEGVDAGAFEDTKVATTIVKLRKPQ